MSACPIHGNVWCCCALREDARKMTKLIDEAKSGVLVLAILWTEDDLRLLAVAVSGDAE